MRLRITLEGKSYEVEVEYLEDSPAETLAPAAAYDDDSEVHIPESVLCAPPPADGMPDDNICRSPIAGVVIAVTAAVGQHVHEGQALVKIEAMKMESTIGAPMDGRILTVRVAPGESVKANQVLLELG